MTTHREHVLAAYKRGLDSASVGYHGTSTRTIDALLATGQQPGSEDSVRGRKTHLNIRTGDIFFYPIEGRCPTTGEDGIYPEQTARKVASIYAEHTSQFDALRESLNVPPPLLTNKKFIEQLGNLSYEYGGDMNDLLDCTDEWSYALRLLRLQGYSNADLTRKLDSAHQHQGLILGYHERVLNRKPLPGNDGHDLRVQPIYASDIVGIEALDVPSKRYFAKLKRRNA